MDASAETRRRRGAITPVLQTFIVVMMAVQVPLGLWAMVDGSGRGAMIWVGTACLLAVGFPLVLRGRSLNALEPIVWCAVAVFLGVTLRAPYLAFSSYFRADELTYGQSYWAIARNGAWVVASLICLSVGYLAVTKRVRFERVRLMAPRTFSMNKRFYLAIALSAILSIVAVSVFVTRFGITLSADSISKKRHAAVATGEGDTVYSSLGYITILNAFAEVAIYYLLASRFIAKRRLSGMQWILVLGLFVVSSILPFITSSRTQTGLVLLNCAALAYLTGRLKLRYAAPVLVILVALVTIMGDLRSDGQRLDAGGTPVDSIIGSGNFFDLGRTTALMDRVPQQTGYQAGETYLALLTAPIPTTMWPEKPVVSLGPWVKAEAFGQRTVSSGWPPNIVGEAHINFGRPGMLVISFLFGVFIRLVYNSFHPLLGKNISATVLYVTIFWSLGLQLFSSNFAHGLMRIMVDAVPALLFIGVAARRTHRAWPHTGSPQRPVGTGRVLTARSA